MAGSGEDAQTLRALLHAARRSDATAFDTLVGRYRPPLFRFLVAQTGDPHLAEDLAQETFLVAFRSLDRLREDDAFPRWLFAIAARRAARARRRSLLRRLLSLDRPLPERDAARLSRLARPADPTAERVREALAALSPALRAALLLYDVQGFTAAEVAAILRIEPAAARKRISRARAIFRARYHLLGDTG